MKIEDIKNNNMNEFHRKDLPPCTTAASAEHSRASDEGEPCDDGRTGRISENKKILWPTDFSENAENALAYVTSLSEKYQAEVHVLYVIEELGYHEPWYGEFDISQIEKIHKWEEKKAHERLDSICEKHLNGCPLYIKHVAIGDPAEEILKLAQKENVDWIVMASRGRKGHFRFGSVAEKIVQNASMPVVTIPISPR